MNGSLKVISKLFLLIVLIISNLEANRKAEVKAHDFTNENVLHDAVRANDFDMVKCQTVTSYFYPVKCLPKSKKSFLSGKI